MTTAVTLSASVVLSVEDWLRELLERWLRRRPARRSRLVFHPARPMRRVPRPDQPQESTMSDTTEPTGIVRDGEALPYTVASVDRATGQAVTDFSLAAFSATLADPSLGSFGLPDATGAGFFRIADGARGSTSVELDIEWRDTGEKETLVGLIVCNPPDRTSTIAFGQATAAQQAA